ncbi:hypothetical protein OE88DRAFT_1650265 [Heliocybe sulcata]|uniref:Uncharacterized protein n=1 Tax=Heliocybe sulcata TaxID=5364 RepID=A0A5C3NJY8_9AGAM|nr:hypothetical protein OE88DRAFT_1650265 [Heliocybe sulcata]
MLLHTWHSTERREGEKTLVEVPEDIWVQVFEHLGSATKDRKQYKDELASISLVCRSFCVICHPLLFRDVKFDVSSIHRGDGDDLRQLSWCQHVIGNMGKPATVGLSVKSYTLWNSRASEEPDIRALMKRHIYVIPFLRNLRDLTLKSLVLDGSFLETIEAVHTLESLVIRDCSILGKARQSWVPRPLRRLQHLDFVCKHCDPSIRSSFVQLVVVPSLRIFRSCDTEFFELCLTHIRDLPLVELGAPISLESDSQQLLIAFLNNALTIGKLHLYPVDVPIGDHSHSVQGLNEQALPSLSWVLCPPFCLADLVPNRPVHGIQVVGDVGWQDTSDPVMLRIMESSAVIRHLCLRRFTYRLLLPLRDKFPHLETLHIYDGAGDHPAEEFVIADDDLPSSIRGLSLTLSRHAIFRVSSQIRFRYYPFDGKLLDKDAYAGASNSFARALPNLTILSVDFMEEWRRPDTTSNWRQTLFSEDELAHRRTAVDHQYGDCGIISDMNVSW